MASKGKKTQTTRKKSSRTSTRKAAATNSKPTAIARATTVVGISREERHRMIAEAAYKLAEKRRFQNSDPVGDWLAAERAIDQELASSASP